MIRRDFQKLVARPSDLQRANADTMTQSIDGFAFDDQDPGVALRVEVLRDGNCVAEGYADKFRTDLLLAQVGNGFHCFEIPLPGTIGENDGVIVRIINEKTGEFVDESTFPVIREVRPSIVEQLVQSYFRICKKLEPDEAIRVAHDSNWKHLLNKKEEYEQAYGLLADEESRRIFRWFIPFRLISYSLGHAKDNWNPTAWIRLHTLAPGGPVTPEQWLDRIESLKVSRHMQDHLLFSFGHYTLPGLCEVLPGDCVIDAGAFDGTSSVFLANKCGEDGTVYAFEPMDRHCNQIERLKDCFKKSGIYTVRQGLSNEKNTTRMRESSQGSHICDTGDVEIRTTPLDAFVKENRIGKIDFIKVDVEGHELKLLEGAAKTIREMKPRMAVSIYHNNEDIFTLPDYIRSLCPDYKFYLRHHCFNSCELVLYCA